MKDKTFDYFANSSLNKNSDSNLYRYYYRIFLFKNKIYRYFSNLRKNRRTILSLYPDFPLIDYLIIVDEVYSFNKKYPFEYPLDEEYIFINNRFTFISKELTFISKK